MRDRCWVLARAPGEALSPTDFRLIDRVVAPPRPGEILVRHLLLSIDPGNRIWLSDRDWLREHDPALRPLRPGEVIKGATLAVVERSEHEQFSPGDIVQPALSEWSELQVVDGASTRKLHPDPAVPLAAYLSILGHTGLTAYLGVTEIVRIAAGKTFLVSAASGAVGSAAGQIAQILGARVVGLTGGSDKARALTHEFGFDEGIDSHSASLSAELTRICPQGFDGYLENVGGDILDAVLPRMRVGGRIAICGLLADYDKPEAPTGPRRFADVLMRRLRIEGFGLFDFPADVRAAGEQRLAQWLSEGRLRYRLERVSGLEAAPAALIRAIGGGASGKLVIELSSQP